ncbi:hypothetical protein [uncultured Mediterranean phage]|nr:hypothetical protein [uncultured Mediterranean phage]
MKKKKKKDKHSIDIGAQTLIRDDKNSTLVRKIDGEVFRFAFYGQDRHLEKVHNSVLQNYYARDLLDIQDRELNSRRYFAGQRFEKICEKANLNQKVTARLEEYIGGSKEDFILSSLDAHSEFHIVIKEIGKFWNILWDVIVANKPAKNRMNELREALDRLILYYDM